MECFERLLKDAYEAQLLKDGFGGFKKGKVKDGDEVISNLKKQYGLE